MRVCILYESGEEGKIWMELMYEEEILRVIMLLYYSYLILLRFQCVCVCVCVYIPVIVNRSALC